MTSQPPQPQAGGPSRGPVEGRLAGKVVLLTGAGGGIGRAVALLFAQAGAQVFASDLHAASLEETRRVVADHGLSLHTQVVDATSAEQVNAWVAQALQQCGRIDVLYNNGAGVHMAPFSEMTLEQWRDTLRMELDVVFLPSKAVWPIMTRQRAGSIINIASMAGMAAAEDTGGAAHSAGKGGVIALTRQLSLEGAAHWIRVNALSPGPIMGPTVRQAYDGSPAFRRLFDDTPSLARYGDPLDVAYAGLFLASDESLYVTGVNLPVDGGCTSKVGALASRG